jgi:CHASE3 domain sensor protein
MRIPIFWRLLLGYSAILLFSIALSSYSFIQLGRLGTTARAALETDNHRVAAVEKLADAFLSEVRYAGRFIITHAKELHDQYQQFNSDFARYMNELQALSTSVEIQSRLSRVADLHVRYHDLFAREVKYIQSAQPYGESRYQHEKEKVLESALRELELLKIYSHKNLQTKLREMERAASNGRRLATVTTLVLVGFGFALCYRISKSITAPLLELQLNTAAEAEGCVDSKSDYSRIPEIQDLSNTLDCVKDHLRAAHESNVAFVRKISSEFATPLVSFKNRLHYLHTTLGETATAEQRTILVVLADETERLVQGCARLKVPNLPAINTSQSQTVSQPTPARAADATLSQRTLSLLAEMGNGVFRLLKTKGCGKLRSHEKKRT